MRCHKLRVARRPRVGASAGARGGAESDPRAARSVALKLPEGRGRREGSDGGPGCASHMAWCHGRCHYKTAILALFRVSWPRLHGPGSHSMGLHGR